MTVKTLDKRKSMQELKKRKLNPKKASNSPSRRSVRNSQVFPVTSGICYDPKVEALIKNEGLSVKSIVKDSLIDKTLTPLLERALVAKICLLYKTLGFPINSQSDGKHYIDVEAGRLIKITGSPFARQIPKGTLTWTLYWSMTQLHKELMTITKLKRSTREYEVLSDSGEIQIKKKPFSETTVDDVLVAMQNMAKMRMVWYTHSSDEIEEFGIESGYTEPKRLLTPFILSPKTIRGLPGKPDEVGYLFELDPSYISRRLGSIDEQVAFDNQILYIPSGRTDIYDYLSHVIDPDAEEGSTPWERISWWYTLYGFAPGEKRFADFRRQHIATALDAYCREHNFTSIEFEVSKDKLGTPPKGRAPAKYARIHFFREKRKKPKYEWESLSYDNKNEKGQEDLFLNAGVFEHQNAATRKPTYTKVEKVDLYNPESLELIEKEYSIVNRCPVNDARVVIEFYKDSKKSLKPKSSTRWASDIYRWYQSKGRELLTKKLEYAHKQAEVFQHFTYSEDLLIGEPAEIDYSKLRTFANMLLEGDQERLSARKGKLFTAAEVKALALKHHGLHQRKKLDAKASSEKKPYIFNDIGHLRSEIANYIFNSIKV